MKATFENIGPIKKAELEVGDLTIIAGQNNTGKTYLAYTLYGFLSMWDDLPILLDIHDENEIGFLDSLSVRLRSTGEAQISIGEYIRVHRAMLQSGLQFFSDALIGGIYSSPNGEFDDAKFSVDLSNDKYEEEAARISHVKFREVEFNWHAENERVVFQLNNPKNEKISTREIRRGLSVLMWRKIQRTYPEAFILSAERFGVSLFYKELDFTKNRLVEELQKLSEDREFNPFSFIHKASARYAKPIKDNIDFVRDLERVQKQKPELLLQKLHSVGKMMDARYAYKGNDLRFISNRRGENKFDIPLHLASSSARGLSGLYFYLKHLVMPGQLLIIDEPESHLSPTNQVLMARLLAFCVNAGLKVLITTHSDYLVKEFNNLIMLNKEFRGKKAFLKKYKKDYTEADKISPDSVRAYVCEDGTLTKCEVDETGINMPVFDDAIEKSNKIASELYWRTVGDAESD